MSLLISKNERTNCGFINYRESNYSSAKIVLIRNGIEDAIITLVIIFKETNGQIILMLISL